MIVRFNGRVVFPTILSLFWFSKKKTYKKRKEKAEKVNKNSLLSLMSIVKIIVTPEKQQASVSFQMVSEKLNWDNLTQLIQSSTFAAPPFVLYYRYGTDIETLDSQAQLTHLLSTLGSVSLLRLYGYKDDSLLPVTIPSKAALFHRLGALVQDNRLTVESDHQLVRWIGLFASSLASQDNKDFDVEFQMLEKILQGYREKAALVLEEKEATDKTLSEQEEELLGLLLSDKQHGPFGHGGHHKRFPHFHGSRKHGHPHGPPPAHGPHSRGPPPSHGHPRGPPPAHGPHSHGHPRGPPPAHGPHSHGHPRGPPRGPHDLPHFSGPFGSFGPDSNDCPFPHGEPDLFSGPELFNMTPPMFSYGNIHHHYEFGPNEKARKKDRHHRRHHHHPYMSSEEA
ncbi:hypothetical protein EDC96DRAFT_498047 [Choanephora cucurbitarum]|nr:hypothetical protein EDC96DRAFT_498047 [Choanephora cucurbitarum]